MSTTITDSPLCARADELAALAEAHRRALAEGPVTVLIGGEPGIGKTRLVAEFTAGLDGARVLTGGCLALGADALPYAPFTAVLRGLVRELGTERVAGLLPGGGRHGLAHWLPELGEPEPAGDPAYGRSRLFDEVLTVIESAAAGRPLVLVLEDLHWADASSRELLLFLVRNLTRPGVLLLVTHRSTDLDAEHPVRPLLTALARLGGVRRVDPAPLGAEQVADWLTAIGRDPVGAGELTRRSQGNPLFLEALLETDGRSTPAPLRELLLAGLRELPEAGRRVVRSASAAEGTVAHELLAAVSGLDEAAVEEAVRPAVARGVLLAHPDGYAFRRTMTRWAVYEDLLPGERARLHARYARALDADPGLLPAGRAAGALATHWYAAGDRPRALAAARRAAAGAAEAYAYAEQLRLLERVMELSDGHADPAVATEAARAALNAGETERGTAHATAALARLTDPEHAAAVLELRSLLKHRGGQDGLDDLTEALRRLPPEAGTARGRLLATLASRLAVLGRHEEADRTAEEALAAAGDGAAEALALVTLAARATRAGDPAAAQEACARATALATAAGDHDTVLLAAVMESVALKTAGHYREAVTTARRGLDTAGRLGLAGARGAVLAAVLADGLAGLGEWTEAGEILHRALAQDPPPLFQAVLLTGLGGLALAQGRERQAAEAAERAERLIGPHYRGPEFLLPLRDLQGRVALAAGDDTAALHRLEPLLADPELDHHPELAWPLLTTGRLVHELRRARAAGDAAGLLTRLDGLTDRVPATGPVTRAHRAQALAWRLSTPAGWAEAVAAWDTLDHPHPAAAARLRLAEAALAAGDRTTAEERLREVRATAEALGARPLLQEADRLAARGRLAPADTPEGGLGLTPRETEVLRLVAAGHSNRRIAEELFISAKTAGVHVSNILAKLRVASRTEAAALAHRLRLFE